MLIETVLSMLIPVCHLKKGMHRFGPYFKLRLGSTMALFDILTQWHELVPDAGFTSAKGQ